MADTLRSADTAHNKVGLRDRNVVLGVTGSIACYKALDLTSKLAQQGALVDVILTTDAAKFVTPLSFRSLTHRPVVTDMFDMQSELAVEHVALARRAEILAVAPATAHTLARLAQGLADDALTATALATEAPLLLAPAMDAHMWDHPATQHNIDLLKERGAIVVGPAPGRLASGLVGMGRLVEPAEILGHIQAVLGRNGDLAGRTVVISAGGTREPVDPVRVITNRSSGKMGYALAEAARDRGAHVVLVSTVQGLTDPIAVEMVRVETAEQMKQAVLQASSQADALIMAAAVADYRPASVASSKVKKSANQWTIDLEKTDDILAQATQPLVRVGFAAESNDLLQNAKAKVAEKNLDLIVANDVTAEGSGFGADTNKVLLIHPDNQVDDLPLMSKQEVAHQVLDRVAAILHRKASDPTTRAAI